MRRAEELHRSRIVVDAHFDLLMEVLAKREAGRRNVMEDDILPAMREAGLDLVVSSIFIEDQFLPEMALRRALDQIAAFHQELDECGHLVSLCRSWGDVERARAQGKLAVILSFEGVEPLGNDLRLLRVFYELGVRGIGLVWSRRNFAGDGCFFVPRREGQKGGLTDFGVALLDEARDLNMFIDVSHLNDEGFWDVTRFWDGPFVASHSNCRALAGSMRNLTDDQIMALADHGGVMGMNCCSSFVVDQGFGVASPARLADHVDHIRDLVGLEHVGFGFDFCDWIRQSRGDTSTTCDCVPGYGGAVAFTAELLFRGYADEQAAAIIGGNWARVYGALLP
ncbi:MAG: membrane dipeptidase [Dethiosulfovibrio peptidovorans]|nr:MAG: membrane dipeptidase [Dethiosulfovibrio peptidovorans]